MTSRRMPGDVVNDRGDIATSSDGSSIDGKVHCGRVVVRGYQAVLARPHGWRIVRRLGGALVEVERPFILISGNSS